tara:strand:+ start:18531 stop:20765 length:2235 start_codon:yes stop_codon:yes gene_type:complete
MLAAQEAGTAQVPADDVRSAEAARLSDRNVIIVTATRREQILQDVPLSVTALGQVEMTEKGVVGYEGVAEETPGVILNKASANFNNFTARGINVNGYNAGLQSTVAVYIDELPISANGNSTILNPNLFDVERVEFLRGPQGTLFGSGSLAGALRIITKAPDTDEFKASFLVDTGLTDGDAFHQRYNAMVNVPLADNLAFRAVGFYRYEQGWIDNIGTGVDGANTLKNWGGRAALLYEPTDRLSIKLQVSHEESKPQDSGLVSAFALDRKTRISNLPDRYWSNLDVYNATINYDFDFATLISSSTLSKYDQYFVLDLAGTFSQAIPFGLDAYAYDDIFVQETRLVSSSDGPLEWVIGGFYYYKRRDVDFYYRSTEEFLAQQGITGGEGQFYQIFFNHTTSHELAGFGELTYRFSDRFWATGGLRYGSSDVQTFTEGGYTSNYFALALGGMSGALTRTPVAAGPGAKGEAKKLSWKASVSFKPVDTLTTYATVATGFRTPVVNARAGQPSFTVPADQDIIIPDGASSDKLTSYEIGAKGSWLGGDLTAAVAAYYIDWKNIQVQANRLSDQVQFATNIGAAVSKGIEFEMTLKPLTGLSLDANGSINSSKVTKLSATEAGMSGAVEGARMAFPKFQGTARAKYTFPVSDSADGWVAASITHVGSFPNQFPNIPGQPGTQTPTYGHTESHESVGLSAGYEAGGLKVVAYVENLLDSDRINYIHPEAFTQSRYGVQRPRTLGVRVGYDF